MKNETVNLGNGAITSADAEKYLVYDDGTRYLDIGGQNIILNENSAMCIIYNTDSKWHDVKCNGSSKYKAICEFNCDNANDN